MEIPTITYDPTNPFMFRGTEKLLNYYLVAQKGPIILGIRILAYQISDTQAHVGFRIRCQKHPESTANVDPAAFTSTWPQIEWTKADHIRASKVMIQTVEMQPGQWYQLDKAIKKARLIGKLMALLGAAVDTEDLAYEQEELNSILMAEIEKQVGVHTAQGNTGVGGEVSANKEDPLVDGNAALKAFAKEQVKAKAKAKAEEDGTPLPEDFDEQVDAAFEKSKAVDGMAEAGDPLAAFMASSDDDDDSGLLPN